MSDIVSQPNDSTEESLRKAVGLLGQIKKTGTVESEISGQWIQVSGGVFSSFGFGLVYFERTGQFTWEASGSSIDASIYTQAGYWVLSVPSLATPLFFKISTLNGSNLPPEGNWPQEGDSSSFVTVKRISPITQPVSGTVTANVPNADTFIKPAQAGGFGDTLEPDDDNSAEMCVAVHVRDLSGNVLGVSKDFPVSGTVTVEASRGAATKTRGTTSTTANTSAAAPAPLNATQAGRKYLLFQNISDTDMYINFGANATTDDLLVPKNGGGIVFESGFVPTDSVNVICSAASKKYFILSA